MNKSFSQMIVIFLVMFQTVITPFGVYDGCCINSNGKCHNVKLLCEKDAYYWEGKYC